MTLFIPGESSTAAAWKKALAEEGVTWARGQARLKKSKLSVGVEFVSNDGHFGEAFSFGTVKPALVKAIDHAPSALVLSVPVELNEAPKDLLALVRALQASGALAVRIEESKLGYAIDRWCTLLETGDVFHCAVVVLDSADTSRTCGMHVFGLPDAQVGDAPPAERNRLLTSLSLYQLFEAPELASGHTFHPDAKTPRRMLQRWPDDGYPASHVCHNPFGVWRLSAPVEKGNAQARAFVFMPPLVTLLRAAEKEAGKALTRKQVRALVEGAGCIAMSHADARAMEKSRGFLDLDPELTWEQWQLVR